MRAICLYVAGSSARNERSSSSHLSCHTPRRLASGANRSSVSRAARSRIALSALITKRKACVRSASLINTTRTSSTIASSILRRFSACAARSALSAPSGIARISPMRATPMTSCAISEPKRAENASLSNPSQCGAPMSTAARTDAASSLSPATMAAVPSARSSQGDPSLAA